MKDKLLNTVEQKIAQAFNEKYLPQSKFNADLEELKKIIQEYHTTYNELRAERSDQVTLVKKETYIEDGYRQHSWSRLKVEEIKERDPQTFDRLSNEYDSLYQKDNRYHNIVMPFKDYLHQQIESLNIDNVFIRTYTSNGIRLWANINNPDQIITEFSEQVSSKYKVFWDILEQGSRIISKLNFTGFDEQYVNVGTRSYSGTGRHLQNSFEYLENGSKYPFTFYNDCEPISGVFVNIFILSKKELRKISFNDAGRIEDVTITIFKDVQQVRVKGNCIVEVQRHKHFNPEIIVCRDEDEAFKIKDTINKFRVSRPN